MEKSESVNKRKNNFQNWVKIMEFEKKKVVKILVIDDLEVNVIILEEIIQNMGYEALTATSVKEALELMQNEKALPQVILTDISMPDIDGYEFCAILKRDPYTKDIPLIFISAMDSSADKNKGFELGAVDYIAKPFERAEVEKRINTHLKLYTLQRDLEENNKRLSLVVTKQMEKLRIEQKNIMLALARLIENKECVSGNHHSNIAYNSRILAQAMQMSPSYEQLMTENFIDTIESAAGLHDIGKILIPDAILLKKGPLTGDEFEIMKTHSELGAKTLMDIYEGMERNEFIEMAIEIAYYHHENWNGTGYPRQLNGIEIPLSARIVRVIDVFDSMLSERAYRKAYPLEEVLKFIENGAGANFDPVIVEIFLKIYRNFKIGRDSDK